MSQENESYAALGFPDRETFEFPNIVNVEVYRSACPCECRHCPVGSTPPADRPARFGRRAIDLDLYRRIVAEMAAHPGRILRVHSVGEPLLWPELSAALASGRSAGVRMWVFTCAVTTDRGLLDALARDAHIVEVSVNSVDRRDYLQTKGVDAFDRVVENLAYLRGLSRRGAPLRLIVSRVQSTDRAADERFVRYWKASGLVHDAFVRSYHTYNDLLPVLGEDGEAGGGHSPCRVHWTRFNINTEGKAVVCFNELFKERLDPSLILGDLARQSIAEIWHGPALTALREAELSGDYSRLAMRDSLPCRECRFCQPLRSDRQTSEHQVAALDAAATEPQTTPPRADMDGKVNP